MNKYDPNEVFINSFGRRIKKTGTKVDIDPMVKHCALLDYCFCTMDGDCGDSQTCTTLPGYEYKVCQTQNEIPIDFFPKAILPNATSVFDFFAKEAQALATALLSNCSVESLLYTLAGTGADSFGNVISGFIGDAKEAGSAAAETFTSGIKNLLPNPFKG